MTTWVTLLVLIALVTAGAIAQPSSAPEAETIWIPTTETTLLGHTRELRLETFLYRPPTPSRVPVLIFNHGSTGGGRVPPTATIYYRYPEVARFFVDRGFAVVIPMRRGRGASGGEYLERYECDRAILSAGIDRGIDDVQAAISFVSSQPWADMDRWILGGMSRGGLLSVVYSSRRAMTAKGVINFAGGWTIERCDNATRVNTEAFAGAGRAGSVPMLWLYSENDRNYGPAAVRAYHRAFTDAGGTADLQLFPPIGHDGHILLPPAVHVWQTPVADFLARLGFPGK
jgi:dienelactone hydrolase